MGRAVTTSRPAVGDKRRLRAPAIRNNRRLPIMLMPPAYPRHTSKLPLQAARVSSRLKSAKSQSGENRPHKLIVSRLARALLPRMGGQNEPQSPPREQFNR